MKLLICSMILITLTLGENLNRSPQLTQFSGLGAGLGSYSSSSNIRPGSFGNSILSSRRAQLSSNSDNNYGTAASQYSAFKSGGQYSSADNSYRSSGGGFSSSSNSLLGGGANLGGYSSNSLGGASSGRYQGEQNLFRAGGGQQIRILRLSNENSGTGDYRFDYETENQIRHQETGQQKVLGNEQINSVQGSYSYSTPEGQQLTVNYIADENGYRAQGDHLPTQPDINLALQSSGFEGGRRSDGYQERNNYDNSGSLAGIGIGGARNRQYLSPGSSSGTQGNY